MASDIISITIGGNVVTIGQSAFSGADVRRLNIPVSLSSIEENAFLNCVKLTKVYYESTTSERETNLTVAGTGNDALDSAAWFYTDDKGNLDAKRYKFQVSIDGAMYSMSELISVTIQKALFDSLSIGNAYSAQIEIKLIPKTDADEIGVMGEIIPYSSENDEESEEKWVQLGKFYIDERSVESGVTTLIGYDAMLKSGYSYSENWESIDGGADGEGTDGE